MKMLFFVILAMLSLCTHARSIDRCASNGENPLWNFVKGYKRQANEVAIIDEVAKMSSESPLSVAVLFGYDLQSSRMLKAPEVVDKYGARALYVAASMGRLSSSKILIDAGVSPKEGLINRCLIASACD